MAELDAFCDDDDDEDQDGEEPPSDEEVSPTNHDFDEDEFPARKKLRHR